MKGIARLIVANYDVQLPILDDGLFARNPLVH
jgi:hypothetical protein